jgi:penicillin V acylase-like amidase (Ntn superfamily)
MYFNYNNHNFPQGGVNEAGVFFDANMVEASDIKDADKKIYFPGETNELMLYALGHCKTVPEVLTLFDKYKIPELTNAQIHLADKAGNMGIITADSSWLTSGNFQYG